MHILPQRKDFTDAFELGQSQVVWTTLVADLETPVAAMMKLAEGERYGFLLESIEGGAVRGRYSYIGLRPDLIWRCYGEKAEVSRSVRFGDDGDEPCQQPSLASLRALVDLLSRPAPPRGGLEPWRTAS